MALFRRPTTDRDLPDFRTFFEAVPSAYLVLSPTFEILAASDAYLRVAVTRRDLLIGRRLDDDFSWDRDEPWIGDMGRLLTSVRRVIRTGKPHRIILRNDRDLQIDAEGVASDGRRWFSTNSPVWDAAGHLACILHRLESARGPEDVSQWTRRLEQRLIETQEEDRARIARELHDQMAQYLATLMLGLESLKGLPTASALDARVDHLQNLVQEVGNEVHRLTWNLRPAPIEDLGFRNSLERCGEELSLNASIQFHFHSNLAPEGRYGSLVETISYRIVQEGLANIIKHARATTATVVIRRITNELQIIIEDDGVGFDAAGQQAVLAGRDHTGLRGMRERLKLIGGSLQIESTMGTGTSLFVKIPLQGQGGGS